MLHLRQKLPKPCSWQAPCSSMSPSHRFWAYAAVLIPGPTLWADKAPNPLTDPFQVTLGSFFVTTEPIIQLNGESRSGDRLDWASEFGGLDADRLRLDCHWRFSDRQKIRVAVFSASRRHSEVLDRDIDWGDETYPAHAEVEADFSFSILEVAYQHAIVRRQNYEVEATLGLHYTSLKASLDAEAEASGGTLAADLSESARLDAPLPVLGLGAMLSLPHDFWLDASAQFFALSVGDYDGHLQSYRVALTWQPKSWLGVGLGYNLFEIDLNVDNDKLDGNLDWIYRGPMLYYRASF